MNPAEENDSPTRLAPVRASSAQRLTTGALLKNRFELLEEIGRGGMGTVYKALDRRDIEAGRTAFLAVKVLNEELGVDNALLKALHGEARKSQELAHPNIVTVYDFDRDGDRLFMTMEYMDGVSLDQVIRGHPDGLPPDQALAIIDQLGAALAYAHSRHIIHSDFKPSNVFVSRDKRVKVIDFGIARVVKSERREKFDAGILRGLTPAYASPEMWQDREPDPRDDIYALACIAYELLTGRHPYDRQRADSARRQALVPKKPDKLGHRQWQTLLSGLQLDRDRRINDVTPFYQGLHVPRRRLPLYLAAALVPLALIALVWLAPDLTAFWHQPPNRSVSPPQDTNQTTSPNSSAPASMAVSPNRCWTGRRTLLKVHLETQPLGQKTPQQAVTPIPALYARVHRALKPYGLNIVDTSAVKNGRHLKADYLLGLSISVRETPITAVRTAMKTVQGGIALELVETDSGRVLNTADDSFKQAGLDMLEVANNQLDHKVDALSAELFDVPCP